MDMKVIRSERRMCLCCMEEHEVKTVLVKEHATFKNRQVAYDALYTFCDVAEELYMDEQQGSGTVVYIGSGGHQTDQFA